MAIPSEVAWLFELELLPGQLGAMEALVPEIAASTEKEPGARAYQVFINTEGTGLCVYERYADSEAALVHMGNFGERFGSRFMPMVKPLRFTVLGSPSEQLMEAIAPLGATVNPQLSGFVK